MMSLKDGRQVTLGDRVNLPEDQARRILEHGGGNYVKFDTAPSPNRRSRPKPQLQPEGPNHMLNNPRGQWGEVEIPLAYIEGGDPREDNGVPQKAYKNCQLLTRSSNK